MSTIKKELGFFFKDLAAFFQFKNKYNNENAKFSQFKFCYPGLLNNSGTI